MFRRRRETMIALRARHQSLEVARDLAYPPLEVTPPPMPPLPVVEPAITYESVPPPPIECDRDVAPPGYVIVENPDAPPSKLFSTLTSDIVLSVLAILTGIAVILLCKYG